MTTGNRQPPTLTGCDVLPPMDSGKAKPADAREPKRKPGKRKAGDRFAVLNAFVDCTAGRLSRGEILVWLVLYRDTRNGIAKTSQADIARRAGISDRTVRRDWVVARAWLHRELNAAPAESEEDGQDT